MKRYMLILLVLVTTLPMAWAQGVDGAKVDRPVLKRSGEFMTVSMTVDLSALQVESNRAVLLTPLVMNGENSLELPSVGIYGRNRYYYYVRNGESMLTGKGERSYRASRKPVEVEIRETVPYQEWMDGAQLVLRRYDYGCCGTLLTEQQGSYADYREPLEYRPVFVFVRPEGESLKTRSLSGSAYIDFVVNRTDIRPDYRKNRAELAKIQATIDSVKNDRDMTITAVAIKGYASPEGSYASNARLAQGRTEALKDYVQQQYHFPSSVWMTDFEAEDWAGLRAYMEKSELPGKEGILAIVDGDETPDRKERLIRQRYPETYRTLLAECYPALRHSDYKVEYIIRSYTDVEEIKRIFHTAPQKLSLQEFYLLAQQYEAGSEAFDHVFEMAVKVYPEDAQANLNAANAAMEMGDLNAAAGYLQKAGNAAEAVYARGVLAALEKDYPKALPYFKQAESMGVVQAKDAAEQMEKMMK